MTYEFGKYKVEIDIEKTRDFYEQAENITGACTCDGCVNFEQATGVFPFEVRKFFSNIGVDIRKAAEIIPYTSENNGSTNGNTFYYPLGTGKRKYLLVGKELKGVTLL